jgi:hypothetical protein
MSVGIGFRAELFSLTPADFLCYVYAMVHPSRMPRVWLRLLILGLLLLAFVAIFVGRADKPSTAVPNPTETAMDYPY